MAATFTVPGAILDGMAPHLWLGPTAAQDWYRDVLVEGEQHGASDYFVTVGEPLHNDVTGDSAYIVVPATMTFKVRGKQVTQSGAIFTVALRKLPEEWRIARPGRGRKALLDSDCAVASGHLGRRDCGSGGETTPYSIGCRNAV
jgi:hypothetical protein